MNPFYKKDDQQFKGRAYLCSWDTAVRESWASNMMFSHLSSINYPNLALTRLSCMLMRDWKLLFKDVVLRIETDKKKTSAMLCEATTAESFKKAKHKPECLHFETQWVLENGNIEHYTV